MTPSSNSSLRVRIAEAQGWKRSELITDLWYHQDSPHCQDGEYCEEELIPDYPNSLDACAQFEAGLTDETQRWKYISELIDITQAESMEVHSEVFVVATATAHQRCLAYLATIEPTK